MNAYERLLAERPQSVDVIVHEDDGTETPYTDFDVSYRGLVTELNCSAWGMVITDAINEVWLKAVVTYDTERPEEMWQRIDHKIRLLYPATPSSQN